MSDDVIAAPSVRVLAQARGIDLEALAARLGRTTLAREDLDAAGSAGQGTGAATPAGAAAPATAAPADPARYWDVDHAAYGPVSTEPRDRFARAAAANLGAANALIPQVTHHDEARVDALEAFRASLKPQAEARGIRLTSLAVHVMALACTLRDLPDLNVALSADGASLVRKHHVHIGIAVDTPHGLAVPVIRDADTRGLWDIAAKIASLAAQARARKLPQQATGGACMTISSLGPDGGTGFTPIVNPPEPAILGLAATRITPSWTGDGWTPAKTLPIALSYDHRILNGAQAAIALTAFKNNLEEPMRMMIG